MSLLSGCASFGSWFADDPVETIPVTEKFTLLPPPQTKPITTKEVEFNVISKKIFMEALMEKYGLDLDTAAAIAKEVFEDDISLFTLNAKHYGNLGENMQEILRFIESQKNNLKYYQDNVPTPSESTSTDG
jgi:hypothetical protein